MSEAEFDLLLEAVKSAVASVPEDKMTATQMGFGPKPVPANDNQLVFGSFPRRKAPAPSTEQRVVTPQSRDKVIHINY